MGGEEYSATVGLKWISFSILIFIVLPRYGLGLQFQFSSELNLLHTKQRLYLLVHGSHGMGLPKIVLHAGSKIVFIIILLYYLQNKSVADKKQN